MLGIKGVVLESALKFLNKNNQKKNHPGNSGCQIQMTVIHAIPKLSPAIKFSLSFLEIISSEEAKVIDTEEISHCFPFPV